MRPKDLRKDGLVFEVTKVLIEPSSLLHSDYDLLTIDTHQPDQLAHRITPTGHMVVLEFRPRVGALPGFLGRWDRSKERLDIDPVGEGWSRRARTNFMKERHHYRGHHPTLLPERRFSVILQVPGLEVFRGVISFGFLREKECGDPLSFKESLVPTLIRAVDL